MDGNFFYIGTFFLGFHFGVVLVGEVNETKMILSPQRLRWMRLMFARTLFACLFATILCGCGPSAKQLAEQQRQLAEQEAHGKFRDVVAAMKVCVAGATYNEFREKRLALETCYTANQSLLTNDATEFNHLDEVMQATETLWNYQTINPYGTLVTKRLEQDGYFAYWDAMLVITPDVIAKSGFTYEQCQADLDFSIKNEVQRGLTQIAKQCDAILSQ